MCTYVSLCVRRHIFEVTYVCARVHLHAISDIVSCTRSLFLGTLTALLARSVSFACDTNTVCACLSVVVCLCLSVCVRDCLSVCLSVCPCLSVSVSLSVCLSVSVSVSVCLCLSVCVRVCFSVCLSVCLPLPPLSLIYIYIHIRVYVYATATATCVYIYIYNHCILQVAEHCSAGLTPGVSASKSPVHVAHSHPFVAPPVPSPGPSGGDTTESLLNPTEILLNPSEIACPSPFPNPFPPLLFAIDTH